jgi:FxsC-like protein
VPGASGSGSIADTPYFLTSYSHAQHNGHRNERDPDTWVIQFHQDLCREVEELTSPPPGTLIGVLDRDLWVGDDWYTGLPEALASCRVLVPLYCPRYFQSIHCGKEWSAFADQPPDGSPGARQPPPIVPVSWEPVSLDTVNSTAVRAVPVDYGGLTSYQTDGLAAIIKHAARHAEYAEVVRRLARQVAATARGLQASPRRAIDYARLPSAFDPEAAQSPADPRLRVTVVAPRRHDLPPQRTAQCYYGASALDWAPYSPDSEELVALHTASFARSLGFHAQVSELPARESDLLGSGPPSDPEILLVDPWAVTLPACQRLLARANLADKPWIQVVIPWNPIDGESAVAEDRLRRALHRALPGKLELTRATSAEAALGVPSLGQLDALLPWMILAAVKHYLGRARAFPPAGRVIEKPLLHGFTLVPPNPLEHTGG